MMGRLQTGETFSIPEMWVMGFQQSHRGATIAEAIAWWIDQERLAALFEAQRAS